MSASKTSNKAIHVRVMAATVVVEDVAEKIGEALEKNGYELVETSAPYLCREPQEDQSRVYMTLVRRQG